ncbi:MAG: bestrophin family ion channel [Rhodospirillales bacterium]
MYVRRGISVQHLFRASWRFLLVVGLWALLIVYLREFLQIKAVGLPIAPVTTIGVAVSLYLGFKNTSSYNRWWEGRRIWGDILIASRSWANQVSTLIYSADRRIEPEVRRLLIQRHIAWVHALAFQLRKRSRLKHSARTRLFDHRRVFDHHDFHQTFESYRRHIPEQEIAEMEGYANPALYLLQRQSDLLRDLAQRGYLDSWRLVQMMKMLDRFQAAQGGCERLKNTPFPRQVANFGQLFTWFFIAIMPLAFVEIFESNIQAHQLSTLLHHEFMLTLVPFSMLISWIFFLMEKVSDSTEDPFEGGVTDVPISALARTIEIDLLQLLGDEDLPDPVEPIDGVLY